MSTLYKQLELIIYRNYFLLRLIFDLNLNLIFFLTNKNQPVVYRQQFQPKLNVVYKIKFILPEYCVKELEELFIFVFVLVLIII